MKAYLDQLGPLKVWEDHMRRNKVRTIYYAHCVALYGTPQEARDIKQLEAMGFEVYNPNNEGVQMTVNSLKHAGYDTGRIMEDFFKPLVESFDYVAFRALPDGRIPKGVHSEVKWALEGGAYVVELPFAIETRGMTVEQTREYLKEVGYR